MILATLLLTALAQTSPEGRAPAPRPDPATLGPRIGDRLPPLDAVDSRGRKRTLESLRGPNGLVLVIFRSADW